MNWKRDTGNSGSESTLRDRQWKRFIRGPDAELLEELYVPALARAVRYDRCCSYFSSSVLSAAARGFARLIERLEAMGDKAPRPAVRLVINEELAEEDVRALIESGDLRRLESVLERRFRNTRDLLEKERLAMLGWLAAKGLLEVRVGIMRRGGGILHAKYGIITDAAGEAIVFNGSGNESAQGLRANYERLDVSTSWDDPERLRAYAGEFEALWNDNDPEVHTVTLPEALRLKLIRLAPKEPPVVEPSDAAARQKAAMLWRFITEAPYLPNGGAACDATALIDRWPHQVSVVRDTAEAWPEGRLLCDEVGLGKTIEAILVLRRLIAGRGVRRALLLVPAGLLKQWQAEVREKGGLLIPRLEGLTNLVWPDGRTRKAGDLQEALNEDLLLMSRETARGPNNQQLLVSADPWDLVILDEAHAARRREMEEGEFNKGTLLLDLLRQLQLRRKARSILLLSATPMQTHPWEPWDLLAVLGEGGRWLSEFSYVRRFYDAVAAIAGGRCPLDMAREAAALIASDPEFPLPEGATGRSKGSIAMAIAFPPASRREEMARQLRRGAPLARRMHRNTRSTLREYHALGLLEAAPPRRMIEDIRFDYREAAERRVYESITQYIERRFQELEQEKPGKGFVMTIYRRRASSSPQALERSLERRRALLERVAEQKAYDLYVPDEESLDSRDRDDLGEELPEKIPAGVPADPRAAEAELKEVERLLDGLRSLRGLDTKRDRFFEQLRRVTEDGRAVLVFTEYVDTMEYLRENLVGHYGRALACYSGDGGQMWDGDAWKPVTKDAITEALQSGALQILVCTDAASEGLNLQAAGAVINYDLPWNPSKVEQRIGRVDRIGQKLPAIRVVNLFLKDSIDDRVYGALRARCGMFEHFVGAMQPVLARARRMLIGRDEPDDRALQTTSIEVEQDPLIRETYMESPARSDAREEPSVSLHDVEAALLELDGRFGPKVKTDRHKVRYALSAPEIPRAVFSAALNVLEQDQRVAPLSPLDPRLVQLADRLRRTGERLPLVVGTFQSGPFRRSIAFWVGAEKTIPIGSMKELREYLETWDGSYPEVGRWVEAEKAAQDEAKRQVEEMKRRAEERERRGLRAQIEAARHRLMLELGRYLACLGRGTDDLNRVMYDQMRRDIASAARLRQCLEKLGGNYPEWDTELCAELDRFAASLTDNQRRARLLGKEIDAALEDPRWTACIG